MASIVVIHRSWLSVHCHMEAGVVVASPSSASYSSCVPCSTELVSLENLERHTLLSLSRKPSLEVF